MNVNEFAVKVENVSKVYRLWAAPQDRLLYAIKGILNSIKSWLTNKIYKHPSGYNDFYALKDISFEIRKGESWGFVGVNGSGKSTLLKIISGNLRLSSGRVEVNGKVAILDYSSGFNGEFSGRENIFLKATLFGLTRKQIIERLDSIIAFAEIGEFINQPVKTYSSGMTARLGFAIMAHVDADIIITDEALAVGDIFFVQKCMAFIRKFLENGTFLFVSHSTNDVLSLCQKAVWLEHGVIKAVGPVSKVTHAYLLNTHLANAQNKTMENAYDEAILTQENLKSEIGLGQPALSKLKHHVIPAFFQDHRWSYCNHTALRNDILVLSGQEAESVGVGGVKISKVLLTDKAGIPFAWVVGGEIITLSIEILAERELLSPMVGFQLTDNQGQILFAENSHLVSCEQPFLVKKDTKFVAEFTFQMPILPVGEYAVNAVIAIGENEGTAMMLQMTNHALDLHSVASCVTQGLLGLPAQSVRYFVQTLADNKNTHTKIETNKSALEA